MALIVLSHCPGETVGVPPKEVMGPEGCEWSCQSHSKGFKWLVSMATTASRGTLPIFTGPWRWFNGNIHCGDATVFLSIVHL